LVFRLGVFILFMIILTWRHFVHAFTSRVRSQRAGLVGLFEGKGMADVGRCGGRQGWGDEGAKPFFHSLCVPLIECGCCGYVGVPCVFGMLFVMIL
jgi:hypothetical protein